MTEQDAIVLLYELVNTATASIRDAATLLRGPHIKASRDAMRAETSLSRMLETLEILMLPEGPPK